MPDPTPKKRAPAATTTEMARSHAEIVAIVRKAEAGDAAALQEVKGMLTQRGVADILGGNVAAEALRLLVEKHAGKNPVLQASVSRRIEELRADLLGENPSMLEKLLVGRVVATWLHLHHLEARYAGQESLSLPLASHYQKSISAAQKRYLAAIRGLAEVRKLALPVLQVNIAKKQFNVAGTATAPSGSN